jgi:YHS domain-containing protein
LNVNAQWVKLTNVTTKAIFLALAIPALLASYSRASDVIVTNKYCPVETGTEAEAKYSILYKGREIFFCCDKCVDMFQTNPTPYLMNINGLEPLPSIGSDVANLSRQYKDFLYLGLLSMCLLLVMRIAGRSRFENLRKLFQSTGVQIAIIQLPVVIYVVWYALQLNNTTSKLSQELKRMEVKDRLHFATFTDFGSPPVPAKPPVEKRLGGTFYRGNDERNQTLFNNGNYRTCTFHISICLDDKKPLQYGDSVGGKQLFLRVEIVRGPHTPDYFFEIKRMKRFYLTMDNDPFMGSEKPVADRVGLTCLEPMKRWEALFPIASASQEEPARLNGIVYICEERFENEKLLGGRFHYAMQYKLDFEKGRIDENSDVWMGSIYRTRAVPQWKLPLEQWFSYNPIPELPEAHKTKDERILGIEEHKQSDKKID